MRFKTKLGALSLALGTAKMVNGLLSLAAAGSTSSPMSGPPAASIMSFLDTGTHISLLGSGDRELNVNLQQHRKSLISKKLRESSWRTRTHVIHALANHGKLPEHKESIQACLEDNKTRLEHIDQFVRLDAVQWIENLPAEMLFERDVLAAIVLMMGDSDQHVRILALGVLQKFPAEKLGERDFLAAILLMLGDSDWLVRRSALGVLEKLPAEKLGEHLAAIVLMLGDRDEWVRRRALDVLEKLPAEKLGEHLAAFLLMLRDSNENVRRGALDVIKKLPAEKLCEHRDAIVLFLGVMLGDSWPCVRDDARRVLEKLPAVPDSAS